MVLESTLPVRTEDEQGDLRKVDVSLEETTSGYETENALVDVQIPESVDEPIEVGRKASRSSWPAPTRIDWRGRLATKTSSPPRCSPTPT